MKKETILFAVVALVVGVLVGVIFTNARKDDRGSAPSGPVAGAPSVNYNQQISMLEGITAKEPSNRNAWVQLGNAYFDSNQPMKSIEAYDKALALNASDPNVLTDQGVMFRRIGQFQNAIKNFERASELDGNHTQSLFNAGLVYFEDLQDFNGAKRAWQKFLQVKPSGQQADYVKAKIGFIDSHPTPGQ